MKHVKGDEIYSDTYKLRSEKLNGMTYEEYLKSDHWQRVRLKAKRRKNYQKCEFCDCKNVELHHKNYKWILTDFELRSIIALCRTHHQEVHDLSKKEKCSVRVATNMLSKVYKPDWTKKNTPD